MPAYGRHFSFPIQRGERAGGPFNQPRATLVERAFTARENYIPLPLAEIVSEIAPRPRRAARLEEAQGPEREEGGLIRLAQDVLTPRVEAVVHGAVVSRAEAGAGALAHVRAADKGRVFVERAE